MRIGSLFSGAGGLDLAVAAVFGGEVVWHAEVDKAASKVLAHRFPGVPNLGDITAVDWADVPSVDVLCGGFPCQDVSAAGKRAGIKDGTRSGLWSVFAEAIDHLRPQFVVIENVRGLLSATAHRTVEDDEQSGDMEPGAAAMGDGAGRPVLRAAGAVLGDLSDLGYDAQWATVAASSVGAPHRRERVFILGTVAHAGHDAGCAEQGIEHQEQTGGVGQSGDRNRAAPDTGYRGESERAWSAGRQAGERFSVGDVAGRGSEVATWMSQKSAPTCTAGADCQPLSVNTLTGQPSTAASSATTSSQSPVLLPTPNAQDGNGGKAPRGGSNTHNTGTKRQVPLTDLPDLLPTPTTQDGANNGVPSQFQRNTLPLNAEVTLLPTPSLSDNKTPRRGEQLQRTVNDGIHTLNLADAIEVTHGRDVLRCHHPADARLISDLVISCGVCESPLSVEDAARSYGAQWGKYAPAINRWEQVLGRPAPPPTEPNKNGNPRLAAEFSSWLMGWPAGWVTDPAIGISRNEQLKICGNGVVPQQAAAALRYLLQVISA